MMPPSVYKSKGPTTVVVNRVTMAMALAAKVSTWFLYQPWHFCCLFFFFWSKTCVFTVKKGERSLPVYCAVMLLCSLYNGFKIGWAKGALKGNVYCFVKLHILSKFGKLNGNRFPLCKKKTFINWSSADECKIWWNLLDSHKLALRFTTNSWVRIFVVWCTELLGNTQRKTMWFCSATGVNP